ncbi:hypothetical protein GGR51DRAFT_526042 [Nemania sp. FL0031]|nr:hypothetical protein GGR51DRAFT_526042 [Nemania sp. FL0031]
MYPIDLCAVRDDLVEVAKNAGEIITSARPSLGNQHAKKNTTDVVTETDRAVEAYVFKCLKDKYPAIARVGEESYEAGVEISSEPSFVVDPIDGTSNFIHGLPVVCVSLGLVVDRKPVVGVVYNPFDNELWAAARGAGAYTQKGAGPSRQLPLSSKPLEGLQSACVGIEWGSDREGPNFELNLDVFTKLARTTATGGRFVNSLRCMGSAALTICRIAAGQQDLFWECGCWAWDVAAAWCILNEAGGIIVDGHPGEWNPPIDNRRYLAVRPATSGQNEIVEQFWSVIGDGRSTYGPP